MEFRSDSGRVGAAQRTPDGFLRCYLRLAVADRPYSYRNGAGERRQEIIPASELFRADSADSFKMSPITLRHPQSRAVTPDNYRQESIGATGHMVLRERTPNGDFLGISAVIGDREAIKAIEAGWQISPGYRVKTALRSDGLFEQRDRIGNHTAIVERARGGDDVLPLLEGLSLDSADVDDFWYQDDADPSWEFDLDRQLYLQVFGERNDVAPPRRPIVLPSKLARPSEGPSSEGCVKCAECSASSPDGNKCTCSKNSKKGKKRMALLQVDGVGHEVEASLAHAIQPHLDRSDALGDVQDDHEERVEALLNLHEDAGDTIETLRASLAESLELIEDLTAEIEELESALEDLSDSDRGDSADEDAYELTVASVVLVDSIREDGQLLIDRGQLDDFDFDPRFILDNLDELQTEMVALANPNLNTDGWDSDRIDAAYDVTFSALRSMEPPTAQRNDGVTLEGMAGFAQPMASSPENVRKMLRGIRERDDAAFDGVQHSIAPMASANTIKLM